MITYGTRRGICLYYYLFACFVYLPSNDEVLGVGRLVQILHVDAASERVRRCALDQPLDLRSRKVLCQLGELFHVVHGLLVQTSLLFLNFVDLVRCVLFGDRSKGIKNKK